MEGGGGEELGLGFHVWNMEQTKKTEIRFGVTQERKERGDDRWLLVFPESFRNFGNFNNGEEMIK